jgi:hypothetical protein
MSVLTFGTRLTSPRDTSTLDHPGLLRDRFNAANERRVEMRVYNNAATTVVGRWYELAFDGDASGNPQIVTMASGATSGTATGVCKYVGVATEAVATGNWTWIVVQGYTDALVEGTTDVAKDDYLKILTSTSTVAPVKDGTARTVGSCAIARAAQAADSAVSTAVYILGTALQIAA